MQSSPELRILFRHLANASRRIGRGEITFEPGLDHRVLAAEKDFHKTQTPYVQPKITPEKEALKKQLWNSLVSVEQTYKSLKAKGYTQEQLAPLKSRIDQIKANLN